MFSADMFLCVALYSPCRLAFNFVRLGTLLQLSSSNRFLFLYFLIYAARLVPAGILSVRDVIRWQLAYNKVCNPYWFLDMDRDIAVGIATGYRLDGRGIGIRVLVGTRFFCPPRSPDRDCPPPQPTIQWVVMDPQGVKRPGP
jgi:hypothetical protein